MIRYLLFIPLLIHASATAAARTTSRGAPKKWLTLNGQAPAVVAHGGFTGLFPESSSIANDMAIATSIDGVILSCNLQMTKDGVGICQKDVNLERTTNIDIIYKNQSKTYNVNGQNVTGWFAFDYNISELFDKGVRLVQNIMSRPSLYDGRIPITTVDDILNNKNAALWINVQYDQLYSQHNLSMSAYILGMGLQGFDYISSPEIGFLKAMKAEIDKTRGAVTKLFLVFLHENATEPTTNQTYGSILKNLSAITPFVTGIVVPKEYVWPVNKDNYLEAPTTLVTDAHKLGLQVYVEGFANDYFTSYNYSHDPSVELLQFVDNSLFSVDGLITDFPPTASQVISCFAQYNPIKRRRNGQPLIITHNGASGVYPGCTDLAYQQAIQDGADVIDCSVQMSQDGIAFCLDAADLGENTDAMTTFISRSATIPEIQQTAGIFSFDLTWSEIQSLKPQLISPFGYTELERNPLNKNKGKFLTLAEFLELAKVKAVSGILINIENAAYLASKKGLDIVTAVSTALTNATLDKQSSQQVLIQSQDTSVLSRFENTPAYKRLLFIEDEISDAPRKAVEEIRKYADAITLTKHSIIPATAGYTRPSTGVVEEMHAANLSVFVSVMRNEFISIAYDYFADPTIELATYAEVIKVDGIVTEFPATARRYMRSPCSNLKANLPFVILPATPGSMLSQAPTDLMPPASAPSPTLDVATVVDPPLPEVAFVQKDAVAPAPPDSGGRETVANVGLSLIVIVMLSLGSIGN